VALPSEELDKAVNFLQAARHNGAWGIYPNTQVDRHSSAIAVAALRTSSDEWLIRDSTILFVDKYRSQIPGLGIDALTDVVELVKDAFDEQPDLQKAVEKRVKEQIRALVSDEALGGAARLSGLLAAAGAAQVIDPDDASLGRKRLVASQNKDGSWSAVNHQGGSLAATAAALSALNHADPDCASGMRQEAFNYLVDRILQLESGGEVPDLFALTNTLFAISTHPGCDYWLVSRLQDQLLERQNEDGGWSERPDSPSTVEHTGLAVIALTAAGARSHVPTRLAQAALAQARSMLSDVGRQRDRLQADFDEAVQEHCGGLATEVKRLKEETESALMSAARVPDLESEVRRLRRVAEPLAYSSGLLADTPLRAREYLAVGMVWVSVGGVLALAASLGLGLLQTNALTLSLLIGASVVASGFALLAAETRRRRTRRLVLEMQGFAERSHLQWLPLGNEPADERLRALRLSFNRVLDDCQPAVRQELVYMLFDGFVDVPADVAGRRAEQSGMRLGMSFEGVVRFKEWASAAALLEPEERQVLFDQIRRSVEL
jgi:hypothetical protein